MKILHVGPVRFVRFRSNDGHGDYIGPGTDGLGNSIMGLSTSLVARGHKVGLITPRPLSANAGHTMLREALPKGITFLGAPVTIHKNPFAISDRWIETILTQFGQPDVVHFHGLYIPFQEALARRIVRRGWKYIAAPRGSLSAYSQGMSRLRKVVANRLFIRGYINGATAVHALTSAEARDVHNFSPDSHVIQIPNGVDESTIHTMSRLPGEPIEGVRPGDLVIGYVGRMEIWVKGIDLMLDALLEMQRTGGRTGFKILFIGPMSSGRGKDKDAAEAVNRYLSDAVGRLPFPDEVAFVGPRFGEDKWRMLNALDVYFQFSRTEGMSNSVVEALAAGRPCLLTDSTNMTDLLEEADAGWICEANQASIIAALRRLRAAKIDEIRQKGRNAQQYALQHLTWQRLAGRYEEELQWLLPFHQQAAS